MQVFGHMHQWPDRIPHRDAVRDRLVRQGQQRANDQHRCNECNVYDRVALRIYGENADAQRPYGKADERAGAGHGGAERTVVMGRAVEHERRGCAHGQAARDALHQSGSLQDRSAWQPCEQCAADGPGNQCCRNHGPASERIGKGPAHEQHANNAC